MSLNQKNNFYYAWACDYDSDSGEGNLARLFIKKKLKTSSIKIITIKDLFKKKFLIKFFHHKYISPFIGIIYCWNIFIKGKKCAYINYLPLWNFFIYFFLPPKTIIGPITGGANFKSNVIRKYIFPILYLISQIIIYLRFENVYFSTSLLKNSLFFFIKKKSSFNFVLYALNKKTNKKKKDIDFLIYFRSHPNKQKLFPYFFIKRLIILNYKVYIVGDKLNIKGVQNLGKLTNEKVNKYLSRTKFSIPSGENLLSFFSLECINNNVKILLDDQKMQVAKNLNKNIIKINYNSDNLKSLLKF